MTLSTDNVQTTGGQHRIVTHLPVSFDLRNLFWRWVFQLGHFGLPATAQHDVGTTTRHVCGDGNRSRITRLRNDIGLFGVEFSVEHVVLNARFIQLVRDHFGFFDRDSTHQHRLTCSGTLADIFNDRLNFFRFGHIDQIRHIFTDHWAVRWNDNGIQFVDRAKFERFGIRGTGHARQFFIQTEVVLESDRSQRLVLVLNIDAFFRFHSLVQTIRPATALHGTASVFINDDHFAVFHDVIHIAGEQDVSAQCRSNVVHQHDVGRGVK
ncbi:hypothetical protein D3C72_1135470 [compost metagenome]